MGRVKLPIKKIENTTSRQVTFSKRRNGLVKKAYELSVLCDVDVALIMFSPSGRPSFFSGNKSIEEVLERYFNLAEGAHERMRDQQHIRKLLSKLKEETDQICQAPSQMTDSQIQDLRRDILICRSRLKEMEKRLRMFEGDPSDITTVSEAENREYVLRETLKQVQLRKCVLEEYNFHAFQSPQVDAVKSVDVVSGASKKAVDWFPHVETLEFSNANDTDAPVTWTLVHSANMSTLEAGNGINNTLLPQFEQAIHTNSSSTWDHLHPSAPLR